MTTPSYAVSDLSSTFFAHAAVRAVLLHAFQGAVQVMEAAGFESEVVAGLVQLADTSTAGSPGKLWGLERHAVMRDPCTDNYVQICTGLNLATPPGRPAYARMRLQLHELDSPVVEYGSPKAVLVDIPLCEVLIPEPIPGFSQEQALNALVEVFTQGDDPVRWAGEETRNRFKDAFELALQP